MKPNEIHVSGNIKEQFIVAMSKLNKTVKRKVINSYARNVFIPNNYWELRNSGMLWEFHPTFTGMLADDKEEFSKLWFEKEENKSWINLVLEES